MPAQTIRLRSTCCSFATYDRERETLKLTYHNGTYTYYDVSPTEFAALVSGGSVGRYVNNVIKSHRFSPRLIGFNDYKSGGIGGGFAGQWGGGAEPFNTKLAGGLAGAVSVGHGFNVWISQTQD